MSQSTASYSRFAIGQFTLKDSAQDRVRLARTAAAAGRYDDMCQIMRSRVESADRSDNLTAEERTLLSEAYEHATSARLAALRSLGADANGADALIGNYKAMLESELHAICGELLELLSNKLIPAASGVRGDSKVFFRKMAGDHQAILARISPDQGYDRQAVESYEAAMRIAIDHLAPVHPLRLGLANNYATCLYEIIKDHRKACDLAKRAFDDAISKVDQLDEASFKDSTLILQLLRDNLQQWSAR